MSCGEKCGNTVKVKIEVATVWIFNKPVGTLSVGVKVHWKVLFCVWKQQRCKYC